MSLPSATRQSGSRSCGWAQSRSASTPTSRSAAMARWRRSSSDSWPSIRCASGSPAKRCLRCIAPAARPTRCGSSPRRGGAWSTTSASSQDRPCAGSSRRCWTRARSSAFQTHSPSGRHVAAAGSGRSCSPAPERRWVRRPAPRGWSSVAPGALPQRPARRSRRIRPVVFAGAGAALVAAAVAAVLIFGGSGGHPTALGGLVGNTAAGVDPASGRVVAAVALGGTPTSVAMAGGAVWALNADDRTIARIDPASGKVRTVGVGATPTDLAADDGGAWVGARGDQTGARGGRVDQDPLVPGDTRLPGGTHQGAGGAPGQMAVGAGALWVINDAEDLERIDTRSARVTATAHPLRARAVAASGADVWALASDATDVVRVDARTARIRRRIHLHATGLDSIATGNGVVWATDSYDGTLWRVDPGHNIVARTITVGTGASGVTVGSGAVWVINSLRGTLIRVDPHTNRVTRTIALGNTPRDVAAGPGRVWVTLAGEAESVPAAIAGGGGPRPLAAPACGRVLRAGGPPPDALIASDNPLQLPPEFDVQPNANAVAFILREHRFRAGRFRVGYQSCDSSTADSDQSDPGKCQSNAKAYAANTAVVGVVGPYNSDCARVQIPILNRAPGGPLALISGSNSLIGLTHRDALQPRDVLAHLYPTGIRNYARVYPSDDAEATATALLARQLHLRRVFVLDDGTPPGLETAFHFRRVAKAIGLAVPGAARWDATGAGFDRIVARVRQVRADGVLVSGVSGTNGGRLIRALRRSRGRRLVLIGPSSFAPVDFLFDESGGAIVGMYLSNPGVPIARLPAPGVQFVRRFAPTQPGQRVRNVAVYSAAATEALLDAIARSDGTRASVTRQLLRTHLRDSVAGPLSFDRNGDLTAPAVTIMRVKARDGISDVPTLEGAAVDRVIRPPPKLIR